MAPKQDNAPEGPHLLFINSTGSARGRPRDAQTKRQIRQHVMRDIGKARRKPPRNPQVKLRVRSAAAESQAQAEAEAQADTLMTPPSSSAAAAARPAVSATSGASTSSPSSPPVKVSFLQAQSNLQAQPQSHMQLQPQSQSNTCGTPVHPLPPLTRPFWDQHPLAILEHNWAMDAFAAYGLALAVAWNSSLTSKPQVFFSLSHNHIKGRQVNRRIIY